MLLLYIPQRAAELKGTCTGNISCYHESTAADLLVAASLGGLPSAGFLMAALLF